MDKKEPFYNKKYLKNDSAHDSAGGYPGDLDVMEVWKVGRNFSSVEGHFDQVQKQHHQHELPFLPPSKVFDVWASSTPALSTESRGVGMPI